MNPYLQQLQPYPFAKMATLLHGIQPNPQYSPIKLGIGEPQHSPPSFILEVIQQNLSKIQNYPGDHLKYGFTFIFFSNEIHLMCISYLDILVNDYYMHI